MALAIHFDRVLATSRFQSQADLARAGRVTRARLTQILNLTGLAPDLQEQLLFLQRYTDGRAPLTERQIRHIAAEPNWDKQRRLFAKLTDPAGCSGNRTSHQQRSTTRASKTHLPFIGRLQWSSVSFGHGPGYRPTIRTGEGMLLASPLVLPAEQTTLWVGKIVSRKRGEDQIYFRVYCEADVLDYAESATRHVVIHGVELDANFDLVLLSSEGTTARLVDELRIGPTWRSVAPITEKAK